MPYDDRYDSRGSGRGRDGYSGRDGRTGRDGREGRPGRAGYDEGDARTRVRTSSRRDRTRPQTDLLHSDLAHEPISRHALIMGAFGLAAIAGIARLADYQLFNADRYRKEADARRLSGQTLYAKRGAIYDRNGNVLVQSVECSNVYVNPTLIEKKQRRKVVSALVDALGVDEDDVTAIVKKKTTFAYIRRQVDQDDADALMEKNLPGVEFEPAIKRVYPYGNVASQVLGVVNIDNVGMTGLEHQYDEVLTGKDGSLVRERALDGSFIAGGAYKKVPAQDGMDIVLSLDVNIQRAAEDALAAGVENSGAKYGSVIVTDPSTGEILACCSNPTYDPTDLTNASNADLNLRVVTDAYEPGSVFKTFVSAAALETGTITQDTQFQVPATIKVGDDTVGDADKRDYGMTMNVREILRRSSNVGMVMVGEKLGADNLAEYIKKFGFGVATGIDFPGESLGIIKDRDEYDGASLGAMSFGQSLAVAPIEMVRAMSAIAHEGIMTTPHFLKTRAGEEVDWTDGEERAISADVAAQLRDLMRTVVDEGTGSDAQIPGYEISGKTGTAERASEGGGGYQAGNNMASFMGFVSTNDPRVLCYVTLDGTPADSHAAQPVFVATMQAALDALGIEPTR